MTELVEHFAGRFGYTDSAIEKALGRPMTTVEKDHIRSRQTPQGLTEAALALHPSSILISPHLPSALQDININGVQLLNWDSAAGPVTHPVTLAVVKKVTGGFAIIAALLSQDTVQEQVAFLQKLTTCIPFPIRDIGIPPSRVIHDAVLTVLPTAHISVPFVHLFRAACLSSDADFEALWLGCEAFDEKGGLDALGLGEYAPWVDLLSAAPPQLATTVAELVKVEADMYITYRHMRAPETMIILRELLHDPTTVNNRLRDWSKGRTTSIQEDYATYQAVTIHNIPPLGRDPELSRIRALVEWAGAWDPYKAWAVAQLADVSEKEVEEGLPDSPAPAAP